MPNGDHSEHHEIWEVVNATSRNVAAMAAVLKLHMEDANIHHHPPCRDVRDVNRTLLATAGAAILSLLAALGSLVAVVVR